MFKDILLVGLGGFAGSALRYVVGRWLSGGWPLNGGFPWGTFAVNVVGCFLIGLLYALAERGNLASPHLRLLLMAGFCGGFTTFSAFMNENLVMLRAGDFLPFALYTAASLLAGLVAVWLGSSLVSRF
jgi:CrcB protein